MGGRNEREGRVEIFLYGEWGTICGDLWKDTQTKVVCRQLNLFEEGQSKFLAQVTIFHAIMMMLSCSCTLQWC